MKAIVVQPGVPESLQLMEVDDAAGTDCVIVETVAIGVCGTDMEIIEHGHGAPPSGRSHLVLGHESVGRVLRAPDGCGFAVGMLVTGIVRRPDPEPCACCAEGNWDMCLNGRYTERGIKELDGFASERVAIEPEFLVSIDASLGGRGVLVEPTSIVSKAWRKIDDFSHLNCLSPQTALITGAGPIGLLAALVGGQRGLDVHVLDRMTRGPKPQLVQRLDASYHVSLDHCPPPDVVIECTGASAVVVEVLAHTRANSIVCLAGVSEHGTETVDVGELNRELVLENDVVFGSVNASRGDYETAIDHLVAADHQWLDDVIARRVPFERWDEAYERRDSDVKTVIVFSHEL